MKQADVDRINELARLAKTRALTEEEQKEQASLRAAYLREFRAGMRGTLEHTYIERPDGTKEKLHKKKEEDEQ